MPKITPAERLKIRKILKSSRISWMIIDSDIKDTAFAKTTTEK